MRDLARSVWQHSSKFQSLLVLLLMIAAMTVLSDRFLTAANGWNIMRQISVNLCLSIGMTMVIIAGGIDLSVGSILAFAGAVTAGLIKHALPIAWLGDTTGVHRSWSHSDRIARWHVLGLVQRANDHAGPNSSLCRNARDAQYCPRHDDALDQRVSHYWIGAAICRDRDGNGAWRAGSRLDIGVSGSRLCGDNQEDAIWQIHLRGWRQRTHGKTVRTER